eukprot:13064_1
MGACTATPKEVEWIDIDKKVTKYPECICGEFLFIIDANQCYLESDAICCDLCNVTISGNNKVYHCNQQKIAEHEQGYDLCEICGLHSIFGISGSDMLCEADNILQCLCLSAFINNMNSYNQSEGVNDLNIAELLNYYIHIMIKHDTDKDFNDIVEKLSNCNLRKCDKFKRNYRDRLNSNECIYPHSLPMEYYQILDKIHCHYQHCYDIGNRLRMCQKQIDNDIDGKYDNDDTTQIMKTVECLRTGRSKKYHQLNECTSTTTKTAMYHFGYMFNYAQHWDTPHAQILIKPKYKSLKNELINNDIATINIEQFNMEYNKAHIHFNSNYCKQKYISRDFTTFWSVYSYFEIRVDHIFALMIYCNYDALSYEFSKTYRENGGLNHGIFYYLGRYLKEAIRTFGHPDRLSHLFHYSGPSTFYHGIGEKLLFPEYIGYSGQGILIFAPLSTTTEFQVAVNFTNSANGMVVEFGYGHNKCKHFSVDWLSDYSNEKEVLFLQSRGCLVINNIIDVPLNLEYSALLNALNLVHQIIPSSYIPNKYTIPSKSMQTLVVAIIHHRLSRTFPEYKVFETLSEYGREMVTVFFLNRTSIYLDYDEIKNDTFWADLFCHSEYKWFNLKLIRSMFPMVRNIHLTVPELTEQSMAALIYNLKAFNNTKLEHIWLSNKSWQTNDKKTEHQNESQANNMKSKFAKILKKIKFELVLHRSVQGSLDGPNVVDFWCLIKNKQFIL